MVGRILTANPGSWTGTSITFAYLWSRCDASGGQCVAITNATQSTYTLGPGGRGPHPAGPGHRDERDRLERRHLGPDRGGDVGDDADRLPVGGTGPIDVDRLAPPARLNVGTAADHTEPGHARDQDDPARASTITACGGRPVEGALVYATPTPYQQFSATEQPTGNDGVAVLTMRRFRFFPASNQQQLLVVFVRARKQGEDLLGGISTRRLVSFPVNLSG